MDMIKEKNLFNVSITNDHILGVFVVASGWEYIHREESSIIWSISSEGGRLKKRT